MESTTITVSTSDTTRPVPDKIGFQVWVTTPAAAKSEDVFATAATLSLTPADLSAINPVYDNSGATVGLAWNFALFAPFTKMKETIAALGELQEAVAKKRNGQSVTFSVIGSQVSSEAQAKSCSVTALVNNARARAKGLADAAGVSVGPILEIVPFNGVPSNRQTPVLATALFGVLSFGQFIGFPPLTQASPCGIVVKFRLLS